MLDLNKIKIVNVTYDDLIVDEQRDNGRDALDPTQNGAGRARKILASVVDNGWLEPLVGVREGAKVRVIRGFGRAAALALAIEEAVVYADTVPKLAGKIIDAIPARIIDGPVSALEKLRINKDSEGVRTGYTMNGFQKTFDEAKDAGLTEKQISIELSDFFDNFYPTKRDINKPEVPTPVTMAEYNEQMYKYRKGVIRTMTAVYNSPTCLRRLWDSKFRTGSLNTRIPKDGDMKRLSFVFQTEMNGGKLDDQNLPPDASGKINRDNPGPIFKAAWDKYLEDVASVTPGTNVRGTGTGLTMHNLAGVKTLKNRATSRAAKLLLSFVLREPGFAAEKFAEFDAALSLIESGCTDANRIYDDFVSSLGVQASGDAGAFTTPEIPTQGADTQAATTGSNDAA